MEILPAVDIRGGRAVRLVQGDYDRETVFDDDPAAAAQRWINEGAQRLHIVDLDGAREGAQANAETVERIVDLGVPIQVGGGIRSLSAVHKYLDMGVERVIIGSMALKHPDLLKGIIALYADRVVVSIDARDGRVAIEGWTETSGLDAADLARDLATAGVQRFIYTDIASDGMLGGHNVAAFAAFAAAAGRPVIAAGGISSAKQIRGLRAAGAAGAIIGRALYEGTLRLSDVFVETARC